MLSREHQTLLLAVAHRHEQSPALGELVDERLRHRRRPGAHENRVVRRVLAPAHAAVAKQERDVAHAGELHRFARLLQQRRNALDREDLLHEMREQHGLIAGARAHLEHALFARELQQLEIPRMDERLRDGLPIADRQRRSLRTRDAASPSG